MKLLSDFHDAILENNASGIITEIRPHPRLTAAQQFAIYADGYRLRLLQAIGSDYPVLFSLLGDAVFKSLASAYIEQFPPTSYNLDYYPHQFAEFLRHNCNDKFAIEIAVLESAIAEVFMLPESSALTAYDFQNISIEDFAERKLRLRKAARLLQFEHNTNYWFTETKAGNNPPRPAREPGWLLVIRHNNEVHRHNLCKAQFCLLKNIGSGKSVTNSIDATINENSADADYITNNLQSWFAEWMENGVFTL